MYTAVAMARGKRLSFGMYSSETNIRLGTIKLHKQDKMGKSWKEHVAGMKKYDPVVRHRVEVKFKEEKHSS